MTRSTPLRRWLLVLGLFFIPLLLARPYLTQSLWADETSSIWFAQMPVSTLLTRLCDPHPPGYYLGLKLWSLPGRQELWLRLPSVLAALLSVALTYRLGRDAGSRKIGWLAALLLAWHPLQIWYAAELRMYTAVQLSGLVTFWLGWRIWRQKPLRRRDGLLYLLAASTALWLDYSALFSWGILQLWWLVQRCPRWRIWLGLQTAVLLIGLLLAIQSSQLTALGQAYQPVFIAVQAHRLGLSLTPQQAAIFLRVVAATGAIAALFSAWRWPYWSKRRSWLAKAVPFILVAGWLILLMATAVPRLYTVKRLLVGLLPYLALLAAYALAQWPRQIGYAAAGLGLFISAAILPGHPREDWRTAVSQLAATADAPTVYWIDELVVPAFTFYAAGIPPTSWQPLNGRDLPPLEPAPDNTLILITGNNPYRHLTATLPAAFYQNYAEISRQILTGIQIITYRRRLEPDPTASPPTPSAIEKWGLLLPSPLATCAPD